MSNVLLVGNGILRAYNGDSCDSYIDKLMEENNLLYDKDKLNKLSFPQRIVVASGDRVNVYSRDTLIGLSDIQITEEQAEFYRKVLDINVDAILSTNYSFELEQSIYDPWGKNIHWKNRHYIKKKVTPKEKQFGLYEFIDLNGKKLFHIHGNAHVPTSIIIGHYYYGKLLGQIQNYITSFMKRYNKAISVGKVYQPLNWVEFFLISNVYVIGMGMDLAEVDLWWLICCKKRHFPNTKIYFYEPEKDTPAEKKMLLETYGVEIKSLGITCDSGEYDYKGYYKNVLADIENYLG